MLFYTGIAKTSGGDRRLRECGVPRSFSHCPRGHSLPGYVPVSLLVSCVEFLFWVMYGRFSALLSLFGLLFP
ncbi:MAG: hypothetical protein A4E40_00130 [Methanoregulaceae archaeon PtaU1.Bin059]|nr:MAG: hypothetical protein A4E39_00980 [Methanoregulaceae archaeon PtaB.Bin152]OPY43467.1 MAG: hypothetical protein A4E40_00130 [Methanoregulaceae archaeon PtaU1.Bin059]